MDLNLCVIAGTMAAPPETWITTRNTSHTRLCTRLLVTVRQTDEPKRTDVLPIIMWHPLKKVIALERGDRVWIVAQAQRRFWEDGSARRSKIELVAQHVEKIKEMTDVADLDVAPVEWGP